MFPSWIWRKYSTRGSALVWPDMTHFQQSTEYLPYDSSARAPSPPSRMSRLPNLDTRLGKRNTVSIRYLRTSPHPTFQGRALYRRVWHSGSGPLFGALVRDLGPETRFRRGAGQCREKEGEGQARGCEVLPTACRLRRLFMKLPESPEFISQRLRKSSPTSFFPSAPTSSFAG